MERTRARNWLYVTLVLFAVPFLTGACGDDDPVDEVGGDVTEDTVDDTIYDEEYGLYEEDEFTELENAAYLGRRVTVSAEVNRIIEPGKAFVTGEEWLDNGLLVVLPPQATDVPDLAAGDDVFVVGKMVEFVQTDLEADYEPLALDDTLYGDWDDANALLAQTVIMAPAEPADGSAPADEMTTTTTAGTTTTS